MARNRIIYQSEALFVSPSPATGSMFSSGNSGVNLLTQLHRIQDANYDFSVTRQDVNQFGNLAAIDRIILEPPTVNLSFSYLATDGSNEEALGMYISGDQSMIKNLINKTQDEKNYFIQTVAEGSDAAGYAGTSKEAIAIGNGFLSNYSHTASVGQFPTCNVSVEGLNMGFYNDATGNNATPAVNPVDGSAITQWKFTIPMAVSGSAGMPTALRPGDIRLSLGTGLGLVVDSANIQSYTLTVPLARQPLNRLGSKFAFAREIQFPITVTASAEAEITALTSGNLSDILCNDASYDLTFDLHAPSCAGLGAKQLSYKLKSAKLDSENFSSSIGANKRVTLQWSSQIGSAEDTAKGFFLSGAAA